VIFDTDGNLIGSDGNHLKASPDPDTSDVWLPNIGDVHGMDWLTDGDIVAASGSAIVRINAEDGKSLITSGLSGYGITVGPDGMVYVGGAGAAVMKVDPETGDSVEFVRGFGGAGPRVTDFSPDYSRMYIGTLGFGGRVYAVDLDEDLEPLGDPYRFAEGVGGGYHDGMGVDVCGNVYVNDFHTFSLYRITPGGEVSLLKEWTWKDGGYGYGHGQDFGSGLSVWRTDAIYVPQPYDGNTVAEVVVEIPGRKFNNGIYEVINVDD
jgi:sugar lactone lactonase YvrE